MQEFILSKKSPELCIQTFGTSNHPCIILIAGAAGQGILWNEKLCLNLVNAGYFVIRFDNRDTGKSTSFIYEESPYNLKDMAEDVISILDQLNIYKAHIVGLSMGGYIAQFLAKYFPERIIDLCFIMTTINSLALRGIRNLSNLPGQDVYIVNQIAKLYQTSRFTMEDRIKSLTEIWKLFNGTASQFPYDEFYALAEESYARAKSKNAVKNHRLAILNSEANRTEWFQDLKIPLLIIHGKADPIIHIQHAYYTQKHIPHSKLLVIEKMGHILSSLFVEQISDQLLEFFSKAAKNEI